MAENVYCPHCNAPMRLAEEMMNACGNCQTYRNTNGYWPDQPPYQFNEKPAAKSTTFVLNASVCQRCGCKLDGKKLTRPCDCKCHKEGARS